MGEAREYQALYLPPVPQDAQDSGRVILRDGSTAMLRVSREEDAPLVAQFVAGLSPESRLRRFFTSGMPGTDQLQKMLDSSDPKKQLTLMVFRGTGDETKVIALGSYSALGDGETAEVAMVVDDAFHRRGLGTILLERLSIIAAIHGIRRFQAVTQQDNRNMLEVFRRAGMPFEETAHDGKVIVDLSVVPSAESVEKMEMRDRIATAASLRPLFHPRSIAVIGASRDPSSIGYRILEELVMNRFNGPVYPVNPKAHVVGSIKAYPTVLDIPDEVDLAVIVVPARVVPQVVEQCGKKGVRALIVISAGFAEVGEEGRKRQDELLSIVRGYGMRMIGPNCLGVINTHPDVRMNASFSPVFPPHGNVAMSSQSGALGLAILAYAKDLGLGLTTFVSSGNKADVSGNDLLQYWEEDEDTKVILLYLESFGNPRRFARIARRVSRSKPIVAVKSGRSAAGSRAASSHTAALAASDVAVDALFQQTGVIRADTLDEMFDVAAALSNQPLPPGRRVAIVTNAGGPGILCADACEARGLEVVEFSEETKARLAEHLPAEAAVGNPVDMIAAAGPDAYRRTVATVLASPEVDALVVIYIPVGLAETAAIGEAVRQGVLEGRQMGGEGKPVYGCFMEERAKVAPLVFPEETIPTYRFPESAARALGHVARYAHWRREPVGMIPDLDDVDPETARRICQQALAERGRGWLNPDEVHAVLKAFRLPVLGGGIAATEDEAVALAQEVGFPVVLKLASTTIVHKTEFGGVKLNLTSPDEVRAAWRDIQDSLRKVGRLHEMEGGLVQPFVTGGVEVVVGVATDPTFGPLVAFGLGGIHVEVLKDVIFRVTPLTDRDARAMIRGIRGYRLLEGYRGHPPADVAALEDMLLRVSRLVEEVPYIQEMDMNPVLAMPPGQGCRVIDARILVADD